MNAGEEYYGAKAAVRDLAAVRVRHLADRSIAVEPVRVVGHLPCRHGLGSHKGAAR